MSDNLIFNDLKKRLIKRGFAYNYIDRIITELSDHKKDMVYDLVESGYDTNTAAKEAEKRLGDSEELSTSFIQAARNSSFIGRHPSISFILFPFFLFVFLIFSIMFFGIIISEVVDFLGIDITWVIEPVFTITNIFIYFLNQSVYTIITLIFCVICKKFVFNMKWALISSFIMAVLGFSANFGISKTAPDIVIETGATVDFTIYVIFSEKMLFNISYLSNHIRFLLPVICFILFYLLNSYLSKKKINSV